MRAAATRQCVKCSHRYQRGAAGCNVAAILVMVLGLGLVSCASLSNQSDIELAGLVLINDTTQKISNIELSVVTTGELVRCAYIPARQRFSTTFPVRRYRKQPVKITWYAQNQVWTAGPLVVRVSDEVTFKTPAWVKVVLGERGKLYTSIVSEGSLSGRLWRGRE